MLTKKEIGNLGESIAASYLRKKGYEILEKNWRYSRAEIDLIAKQGEILVFIEVKTRSYDFFGKPEESVSTAQEHLIMDAAQRYMDKIEHDWEIRFDIISIILDKKKEKHDLQHFEDAFF